MDQDKTNYAYARIMAEELGVKALKNFIKDAVDFCFNNPFPDTADELKEIEKSKDAPIELIISALKSCIMKRTKTNKFEKEDVSYHREIIWKSKIFHHYLKEGLKVLKHEMNAFSQNDIGCVQNEVLRAVIAIPNFRNDLAHDTSCRLSPEKCESELARMRVHFLKLNITEEEFDCYLPQFNKEYFSHLRDNCAKSYIGYQRYSVREFNPEGKKEQVPLSLEMMVSVSLEVIDDEISKPVRNLNSLLTDERNKCKRVLISGSPGSGKSILAKMLAYKWAALKSSGADKCEPMSELERRLTQFQQLFLFTVDDIQHIKDRGLLQTILKKYTAGRKPKESCVRACLQQEPTLLVIDGIDDFTPDICPAGVLELMQIDRPTDYDKCVIIIFSRSQCHLERDLKLHSRLNIVGFNDNGDILQVLKLLLPNDMKAAYRVHKMIKACEDSVFRYLCHFPLFLLYFYSIAKDRTDKEYLDVSRFEVYDGFFDRLIRHDAERRFGQGDYNVAEFKSSEDFESLCRHAYNDLFHLRDDFDSTHVELREEMKVYLVKEQHTTPTESCMKTVFWCHPLQQYLAAIHFTNYGGTYYIEKVIKVGQPRLNSFVYFISQFVSEEHPQADITKLLVRRQHQFLETWKTWDGTVKLSMSHLSDTAFQELLALLKSDSLRERITAINCQFCKLTDQQTEQLCSDSDVLPKLKNLKAFIFSPRPVGQAYTRLVENLPESVDAVFLQMCGISTTAVFFKPNYRRYFISHNNLVDCRFEAAGPCHLTFLKLTKSELRAPEIASLAKCFPNLRNLQKLWLGRNEIDSNGQYPGQFGGALIAEQLHNVPDLLELKLQVCGLTLESLNKFALAFSGGKMTKFRTFNLCNNENVGKSDLLESLSSNTTLNRLNFIGCGLTGDNIAALKRMIRTSKLKRKDIAFEENPLLPDSEIRSMFALPLF